MEEKILNLIREMISLDEWKFLHIRVGTTVGTNEIFFANPNQPKEKGEIKDREKTEDEKVREFLKENPEGLIVDDKGIKVD